MIAEDQGALGRQMREAMPLAWLPDAPPVGQTPKEVVWSKNKARLYRYHSDHRRHPVPLVLVYALINKPYILDLTPGNSLVEYLVAQGFDVFLLDWGVPGEEDASLRFDDYVLDYLNRAIAQVTRLTGQPQVSLLGYCMGGTIALMYAALEPDRVRNLTLLATPVDFSEAGLFTHWLDPEVFNVDRVVDAFGLVPAPFIELGSKLLKPLQNYWAPTVNLLDRLDDEGFVQGWLVMNQWVNDGVPFAGEAYRQWIKWFYQQNRLIRGEVRLKGRPVDLSHVRAAILNVRARQDHIVQACQAEALKGRTGSQDYCDLVAPGGHVGLVSGRAAKHELFPRLAAWLSSRSH